MGEQNTPNKPIVFVILPFSDECLSVYEDLKKSFADVYTFIHAGDMDNQRNIIQDIVRGIVLADVVIADLTGSNPNVYYELGLAHALNKKTIIITQDINELPFDIKSYRVNEYSLFFNKYPELRVEIEKLINGAVSKKIEFGNPVTDFVKDNDKIIKKINSESKTTEEIEDSNTIIDEEEYSEIGFVDRIAIIEETSALMGKEIESIGDELIAMNCAVDKTSTEMSKVNKTGGSSTAVFARNACRKLAAPITEFGENLSKHVDVISSCWEKIENNYLALLNDKWIDTDENQKGVEESLTSLRGMKDAIYVSNGQVEGFKDSLNSAYGIERKLNQAIKITVEALNRYLTSTDVIASSIGRIETRTQMIFVGE